MFQVYPLSPSESVDVLLDKVPPKYDKIFEFERLK